MKKMKRIFAVLLSIVFVLNTVILAAEEDVTAIDSELLMRCEVLQTLGILEDSYTLDKELTRGEFANYVAKMLDLGTKSVSGKVYFNDIDSGSVINALYEKGIMNGVDERIFAPSETVELNHAYVTLTRALGYRFNGGIIKYMNIATLLDLDENVSGNKATLANVVNMIFNCLNTNVLELDEIAVSDEELVGTYNDSGVTLMERVFKAYFFKGVVTANRFTALYDADDVEENIVQIDNIKYDCKLDEATELIGRCVFAIASYKGRDKGLRHEVLYMAEDVYMTDTLVINAEDMISYKNNKINYAKNGSEKQVSVEPSVAVIYNGSAVGSNLENFFDIDEGTITLIKNNSNNFNVAVIEEYKNVVVNSVENVDNTIYTSGPDNYKGINYKAINTKDADYAKLISGESGQPMGFQQLMRGDVLSAMISGDGKIVRMYLNTETAEGKFESLKNIGDRTVIVINGTEYEVSKDLTIDKKTIGSNVKYVLDIKGKLAALAANQPDSEFILGYMYAGAFEDKAFNSSVKIKIYTQNDEHIVLDCAKNVKIDGVPTKEKDVISAITNQDGSIKRNMVLFKTNKAGELIYLDTAAPNKAAREAENTLYLVDTIGAHQIDDANMVIDQKYCISTDAYLFGVPKTENTNPSELAFDLFYFNTTNNPFESTTDYMEVGIYDYTDDNPFIDVITYGIADGADGEKINSLNEECMMVGDIIKTYDKMSGDVLYAIQGLCRNKVVEYFVEPGIDLTNVPGYAHEPNATADVVPAAQNNNTVESGDIIRFAESSRGYISGIQLVYDCSAGKGTWYNRDKAPIPSDYSAPNNFTIANVNSGADVSANSFQSVGRKASVRFTIGYIDDIYFNEIGSSYTERSIFEIRDTLTATGAVQQVMPIMSNNNEFMIYDSTRKENKAYIGTPHDMTTFKADGTKASKMLVHWRGTSRISWFLYK